MTKTRIAISITVGAIALVVIMQRPTQTQTTAPPPTATRDAATTLIVSEQAAPGFAMLAGTQGSVSVMAFRARPLIACDQNVFKDITSGAGGYGLASAFGNGLVHVCSYSISNGSIAQDVQFVSGSPASSGSGFVCSPETPVSARFHLAANQFVSQGSGVGSLFTSPSSLCLKVIGAGAVSVNVAYASF